MDTNANNGVTARLKDGSDEQNEQESRAGHPSTPWKIPSDTRRLMPASLVPSLSATTDFHGAVLSLDEERVWCQLFVVVLVECGEFGLALEHSLEDLLALVGLTVAEPGPVGVTLQHEDRLGGVDPDTAQRNVIGTILAIGRLAGHGVEALR